jgi:hypothetical protein
MELTNTQTIACYSTGLGLAIWGSYNFLVLNFAFFGLFGIAIITSLLGIE